MPPGDAQLRSLGRERAHHDRHADALLVLDSRSLSPQICGMSLPPAYLRRKLTQPLPTKSGAVLRTIGEAANYVLALPADRGELCQRWRHATKLILEQAAAAAVSHQVHLALFYDAQLDIKAMDALGRVR
jgi:hypothetical protein